MADLFAFDPPPSLPSLIEREFSDFWRQYPRRVAKIAAEKAYAKARKRVDAPTILAGAMRYALHVAGKDPQYVAHPSTWLAQGRWDDELPQQKQTARDWLREEIANGFDQGRGGEGNGDPRDAGAGLPALRNRPPYH